VAAQVIHGFLLGVQPSPHHNAVGNDASLFLLQQVICRLILFAEVQLSHQNFVEPLQQSNKLDDHVLPANAAFSSK
jgi:hypothetical protein